MKIWVDADACPVVIKEILFRVAERTKRHLILIANHPIYIPPSQFVRMYQVEPGFDVVDNEIIRRMDAGDLVITSDIPLAAEVIKKQGRVLSPRGELYTKENIGARLSMRDFMESLRASGVDTGGLSTLSQNDRKMFAGQLDKLMLI
ncbi:YaiI/YqxD family protein [Nitrosomonas sp.]|uniref:YaiI/YqxD family protein n=1 Tax=Nitrosomonas sp. TaxID=42353 RepID=UPI00260C7D47|nr:YaiI/YqxD family protein [Nitrosomonas sp.]